MSLGFGLEIGVRGLIAHDAGVGRDGAGVSGLPLAFQHGGLDMAPKPPTFGAPRGTRGAPLFRAGRHRRPIVGQKAADAAHAMLAAPRGAPSPEPIVDRRPRVVLETAAGRVVLVDSMLFARPDHRNDVMCAGSHGGRVNMARAARSSATAAARARGRASTACRCGRGRGNRGRDARAHRRPGQHVGRRGDLGGERDGAAGRRRGGAAGEHGGPRDARAQTITVVRAAGRRGAGAPPSEASRRTREV